MNKLGQIILGLIITFLVLMLSGTLGTKLALMIDFLPSGFFIQFIILLFSSILIYFFNKKGIIEFKINLISLKQIIPPVLVTIIFFTVVQLIIYKLFGLSIEHQGNIPTLSIKEQFITIIILASISEELLFRGFLQNMLAPIQTLGIKLLKVRLSLPVVISGIFFGLIHFAILSFGASFPYTISIVLSAMILGFVAGYFQEKNDNFLFAPIIHMAANLSGMILFMII